METSKARPDVLMVHNPGDATGWPWRISVLTKGRYHTLLKCSTEANAKTAYAAVTTLRATAHTQRKGVMGAGETLTGCGKPTHVIGTNGGLMPCGAMFTAFGTTEPYYCGVCRAKFTFLDLPASATAGR